jgi:hypothetical protein
MSNYGQRKNLQNSEGLTLWLKHKMVRKKDGTEKEVFQGSVDIGGGKMIKISIDARLYHVEKVNSKNGVTENLLPAYVSKWKSTQPVATTPGAKKSW